MDEIKKKLASLLGEDKFQAIEADLEKFIESEVNEHKVKLEIASEKQIKESVDSKVEEISKSFQEQYDTALSEMDEKITGSIGVVLEESISRELTDEVAEKLATLEQYAPIIESMQEAFAESYIALDETGSKMIKEKDADYSKLETRYNEGVEIGLEQEKEISALKVENLILTKTQGLSEQVVANVKAFMEGKSFDEVSEKIDALIETEETKLEESFKPSTDGGLSQMNEGTNSTIDDDTGRLQGSIIEDGRTTQGTGKSFLAGIAGLR